jgi:hypothetical protein
MELQRKSDSGTSSDILHNGLRAVRQLYILAYLSQAGDTHIAKASAESPEEARHLAAAVAEQHARRDRDVWLDVTATVCAEVPSRGGYVPIRGFYGFL